MDPNLQPTTTGTEHELGMSPTVEPAVPPAKATGLRRIVATMALTVGLLAVGGASVVMAASPAPSSSSTPSMTQHGGTTGTHNCPNMGTSG